jgi:hypothetical protein
MGFPETYFVSGRYSTLQKHEKHDLIRIN